MMEKKDQTERRKKKGMASQPCLSLLLVILVITPHLTHSLSYSTLRSFSHSLLPRISTLSDKAGSDRAKFFANKLDRIGFTSVVSLGWNYLINYESRDMASFDVFGAVKDLNDLIVALRRNYTDAGRDAGRAATSLFWRLLEVFPYWEAYQRELAALTQKSEENGTPLGENEAYLKAPYGISKSGVYDVGNQKVVYYGSSSSSSVRSACSSERSLLTEVELLRQALQVEKAEREAIQKQIGQLQILLQQLMSNMPNGFAYTHEEDNESREHASD